MTTPAASFAQRLPLPLPGECGGWRQALNPLTLLFWLYLRNLFAALDRLMEDFTAGRLPIAKPPAPAATQREPTTARRAAGGTRAPRPAAARNAPGIAPTIAPSISPRDHGRQTPATPAQPPANLPAPRPPIPPAHGPPPRGERPAAPAVVPRHG